jgi:hypothetical protein
MWIAFAAITLAASIGFNVFAIAILDSEFEPGVGLDRAAP